MQRDITRQAARRFLIQQFALDGVQTLPTVAEAIDRLEFVQEDSISVCGRIHDLILWARVKAYTPALLHKALYTDPRQAFEYNFPNLCVLPVRDFPHFRRAMTERAATPHRWGGLLPEEIPVAEKIFASLDTNGPLRTRTAGREDGHTISGWGSRTTMVARVAEKLWLHGAIAIARRDNFERYFDRAERLLPHAHALPPVTEAEEAAYKARKVLRAKRLFRRKPALFSLLPEADITKITIEGDPKAWYALTEDVGTVMQADQSDIGSSVHLLAPLDPLIYDRERNRILWDFDYTWEVYTPAAKRRWGYYVLPILYGDKIVARIDPKLDRVSATLKINALHFEPGVDVATLRPLIARRVEELAAFLGADERFRIA